MSLRTNMYRGGGGSGRSPVTNAYGGTGIMGLLQGIFGDQSLSGGFEETVDPETGETTIKFNPYQGKKGYFNAPGRGRALELNADFMGRGYERQEEAKDRLEEQRLRQKGERRNLRVSEEEKRKTQAEKSQQDITTAQAQQAIALMAKDGVPYTPENFEKYSLAVSRARTERAGKQSQLDLDATGSPEYRDANLRRMVGEAMIPFMQAQKLGTTEVGPNSMAVVPDVMNPSRNSLALGASELPSSVQEVGGFPYADPKTGEVTMIGGKSTVVPGGTRPASFTRPPEISKVKGVLERFGMTDADLSRGKQQMQQETEATGEGFDTSRSPISAIRSLDLGASPVVNPLMIAPAPQNSKLSVSAAPTTQSRSAFGGPPITDVEFWNNLSRILTPSWSAFSTNQ